MRSRILKCLSCESYTLEQTCPRCGVATVYTFPPRFSPEDRWGKYRIMARDEGSEE